MGLFDQHFARWQTVEDATGIDEVDEIDRPKEGLLEEIRERVTELESEFAEAVGLASASEDDVVAARDDHGNRYDSFAPLRLHNDAKCE
ncbi:hypothetical protein KEM52_006562 [Ascosphaera acerosa]|nr:hypothetical protein KEM52_006562 [Ascosphaera acerosa]